MEMYGEKLFFSVLSFSRCPEQNLVRVSYVVVDMGEDHDATPKDRSEISLKSVKPGRGRSDVSPIYLLQRTRLSPNSAMGAWRNRALKRTAFSHTFPLTVLWNAELCVL